MIVFVNGIEAKIIEAPSEDWQGFQLALLQSSFSAWIEQHPVILAMLAAAFQSKDFARVKQLFSIAAQQNPPSQQQLAEWQAIADRHNIVSVRFLPAIAPPSPNN